MDTQKLLDTIDNSSPKWLFVCLKEAPGATGPKEITRYGTFEDCAAILQDYNANGYGIFFTVNQVAGNKRLITEFECARAVWQDDDTGDAPMPDIPPHAIIETSPGHFQRYWVTHQTDLPKWECAQQSMVDKWGCDPGAKDAVRLLRLPGFVNHKRDGAPVKLISITTSSPYTWEEIERSIGTVTSKNGPVGTDTADTVDTGADTGDTDQFAVWYAQIQAGEHLHTPIRGIMAINQRSGMHKAQNKILCTSLINNSPNAEKRKKALEDLDGMLRVTYEAEEETIDLTQLYNTPKCDVEVELEWPPGLMGELARAANEFFVIPNKTAAIMTALSLVAGITGRKYNVSGSGLNLYTTIMMPTGAGKDSIRKFCQRVLIDKAMLGTNGLSFLGPQNFTGPKALLDELKIRPSMLCVMTEAGLLYKTESGDKNGLTRVILQAYTSSGQYEFIETERYSNDKDSIQALRSPALTILNEATPVTLLTELKKRESINTGELPRMWVFMLAGKKPYNNPTPHNLVLSEKCAKQIKYLLSEAYTVQNEEPPKSVQVPIPEGYAEYARWCTDRYNEYNEDNPNKAIMYTRAAHKVLKVAALISIFNREAPDLDWAKKLFDHEMANIEPIIGDTNDIALAVQKGMQIIDDLLSGKYTGKNKYLPDEAREKGIFTISAFKQCCASIPAIRDLGTTARYGSPKNGTSVLVEYMVTEGLLVKVKGKVPGMSLRAQGLQITQEYITHHSNIIEKE